MTQLQEQLIALVQEVPKGSVVAYGAVAKELMKRSKRTITPRLVGWQLSGMPESERSQLPWRRVVNRQGYISSLKLGTKGLKQIALLEKEGYTIRQGYIEDPEWREF